MSHFRRNAGRFSTHTATEAYQRQLATPVHKWKKAWVSPTGLQPESSYKICKWVRVPKDELDEPEEDVNDDEGVDDEDMENGDENEGDGDDDEAGDEEGDEDVKETETPANEIVPDASKPDGAAAVSEEPLPDLSTMAPPPGGAGAMLVPNSSMITSTEGTSTEGQDVNTASALIEPESTHIELPGNAMEFSNVAPGHTELGAGDLGNMAAGMEMHVAEPALNDVDMLSGGPQADLAEEPTGAVPPGLDEGLVHGEIEQPQEMDDGTPPPEVERS